ncbi:hypothetical protein GDO86_015361 [Hymenochirus boettgeri]|uniref:V-set and immunoglobulin domain-containing protein 1 n=1 Tax=Hymenochirus boettgeri TaxID=247094 RepID=A0A8T2JXY2_9PIPI|nr:hypothetical protein GDO86_015361 [Hymenochirus boettgeri]
MTFLHILAFGLSLAALGHCVKVTVPNKAINVTSKQNATLYCTYVITESTPNPLIVQWYIFRARTQKDDTVLYYEEGKPVPGPNYMNRVIGSTSPGNATITIFNLQPEDTGLYTCEVLKLPSSDQGQVLVSVLVAPSAPHCSIRGAIETGHYLTLMCYSEEGMPRPLYTWNRVENGVLKPTPVEMNQMKGSLIIGNLTKFEEGYYRCTATNYLGNATCELDLNTGVEGGVIAAAIIGAVLIAAILIAVIWFLLVKKQSKKQSPSNKEMKTISSSSGNQQYAAVSGDASEPPKENLESPEPAETIQFHDHAANVVNSNGEMEEPTA